MEHLLSYVYDHWIFISVLAFLLWLCYSQVWKPYRALKSLNLPGPWFVPVIGNIDLLFGRGDMHLRVQDLCKRYGDVFGANAFGTTVVFVKDLDMLKEITIKEFAKFNGTREFAFFPPKKITSQFLSTTWGKQWHNQRQTLSPAFSASRLKHVLKLMNDSCDTLVEKKLREVVDKDEPIDIYNWLSKLTLETILSSAFGVLNQTQTAEDDYLTKLARKAMNPASWILFLFSVPVGRLILACIPDPLGVSELAGIAQTIISTRAGSAQNRKDLLQLMLDSRNESQGKRLSDEEIVAQSVLFLLAGYETSSTALGFLCYQLALHTDIQDKLREEIDKNWDDDEEFPSYETIGKMGYLEMAIQETLRMYPPGHIAQRFVGEDCTVAGVKFCKGHQVLIPIYAIHHDPKHYPEPEKFDPERFTAEEKAKRDHFAFLPFGQGPRGCIGMRFAMMEIKIVMVRMLREYKLEVCSKTQIPLEPTSKNILSPKQGVWIVIKSRKKSE